MNDTKELKKIISPIIDDIKVFQQEFEDALRSEVRLINVIGKYLIRRKGKSIRPVLTILSARLCGGTTINSYKAAAMLELLHMATLIHDDVVDQSKKRRGFPTVHRIWKSKASVIMGDFLLSKVLTNLIKMRDFEALDLLSNTAERLSSGEMLQIERSFKKDMTEKIYFQMIKDKTAALISTSCELGALTSSSGGDHRQTLKMYGENLGMAFQIKDDVFDIWGSEISTGKDTNIDVAKNMITLPIIYVLNSNLSSAAKKQVKKTLSNGKSKKDLNRLKEIVFDGGGIDYAKDKINQFTDTAVSYLDQFPDNSYKQSMIDLALYNAERTR
tara:strand:+ start:14069 stop:15055 length:987 start_codon:yes stop_codon:yes gene_type:complete